MSDYYFKIDAMSNDQILTEMETLRKKQFTVKSETPIWYQIQDMIDFCTQEYQARVMRERLKNDKSSDVMDIGEIDSVDYTPDYSERDTFVEMVSFYSGDKISKQQEIILCCLVLLRFVICVLGLFCLAVAFLPILCYYIVLILLCNQSLVMMGKRC